MPEAAPLGILGGTFDPVHFAHLALAHTACKQLGLTAVRWIPAGHPPHRTAPQAAPEHRLAMAQLAIAADPRFVLDAGEVASTAASYTVHTLLRLRDELGPHRPLILLMGADALRGLAGWHRWRELFDLAHLGVATRPGFALDDLAPPLAEEFARRRRSDSDFSTPCGYIVPFELVAGTVSATEARTLLATGAPRERLLELLPAPVLDYICQHRLYSN